jgi:hypothetical protein
LSAFARTTCPASTIARPSSSPASDSIHSILQRIRRSVNPPHSLRAPAPSSPGHGSRS